MSEIQIEKIINSVNQDFRNKVSNKFEKFLKENDTDELYHIYSLIKNPNISCIYFICRTDGLVKIGKTNNFEKRLKQIRSIVKNHLGQEVAVERVIIMPEQFLDDAEVYFHNHYKDQNEYGEWFRIEIYTDEYVMFEDDYVSFRLGNGCIVDTCEYVKFPDQKILYTDFMQCFDPGIDSLLIDKDNIKESYEKILKNKILRSKVIELTRYCIQNNSAIDFNMMREGNTISWFHYGEDEWSGVCMHDALVRKVQYLDKILNLNGENMIAPIS